MQSIYNSTEGLKVTYFLGAGASYNALPIWANQGRSMVLLAGEILFMIQGQSTDEFKRDFQKVYGNKKLISFFEKLKEFGELALQYGSIDIYARRLYLLNKKEELNILKHTLSVYFDLWESFYHRKIRVPDSFSYDKIDKRYYSLFSILLEKSNAPKLNNNVSFITWNYDLQLEKSYESFLEKEAHSIQDINESFRFMDDISSVKPKRDVYHLNGFRGFFSNEKEQYENVEKSKCSSIEDYLKILLQKLETFEEADYQNHIRYAWESSSDTINEVKKVMSQTNILVIIGYSFPAFNRKIDDELIKEFESGSKYKRVIYQDPNANEDIVKSIFTDNSIVELQKENSSQFYIPHEFLSPSPGADFTYDI